MFTAQAFARTEGYYPSELSMGYFSTKSDVYCYGVVIHTVLCVGFCVCVFLRQSPYLFVLETYTGMKVYSTDRVDKKIVSVCVCVILLD